MTVEPTSGWLDCPALLAGRAPARTRTSLCSDSRAFPARPAAMLGVMRRRRAHFDTAIHGLFARENGASDTTLAISPISTYDSVLRSNWGHSGAHNDSSRFDEP